jgi:hypothetical protein
VGCGGAEDEAAVGGHAYGAGVVVGGEGGLFDGVLGEGIAGCEEDLEVVLLNGCRFYFSSTLHLGVGNRMYISHLSRSIPQGISYLSILFSHPIAREVLPITPTGVHRAGNRNEGKGAGSSPEDVPQ